MSQYESILTSFKLAGGKMRLGEILKYSWGYEFRARATELRKSGYVVQCTKAKKPSDNLYEIIAPEKNGQMRIA